MRLCAAALLVACLAFPTHAADFESHVGPLPIPEGIYGTPEGCLMAHGDSPDGPALWLSQTEIHTTGNKCSIVYWSEHVTGGLAIYCGTRTFFLLPRSNVESSMVVVALTGAHSFESYPLSRCGPE